MVTTKTESKAKKVSKTKDPNEPKKNKSGYMFFCVDGREEIKSENSGLDNKGIVSELAVRWKNLKENNPEKVKYYEDLAVQDKKRYQEEKSGYVKPVVDTAVESKSTKSKAPKKVSTENSTKEPRKTNAYINFCTANRETYKTQNPGVLPKDITKKLSEGWRALSDSEKESYKH
jgi:hypothetical protein